METTSGVSCTESFSRDVISRVMAFYILSHFLVMSFSRYDVTDHEAYPPMSTHGRVTETSGVASVYRPYMVHFFDVGRSMQMWHN